MAVQNQGGISIMLSFSVLPDPRKNRNQNDSLFDIVTVQNFALPPYSGRWNAGSTKRFGGTPEDKVDSFIDLLRTRI